ncbi:probable serine/threonine-protein kinase PBL28 [Phoenix dactylifera]|uniref:Probable serine/threonine-protein kinase PBL28 n=1 Tax=Phoenix dactylifera TaxID=42345 RepID=A0A8B9AT05_PHODC|nr:probable serine/threonine-protein kinase PBL28 [Phoenix dactylifera]
MAAMGPIVDSRKAGSRRLRWTFRPPYGRKKDLIACPDKGCFKIEHSVVKAIIVSFVAVMGLVLLVILIKFVRRSERRKEGKLISTWSGLYRFSKGEIEKAINYGNSKVHLGSGSAGQVYQGILPSRQLVAIKHVYKTAMSGSFTREVEGLSKVRHPNLVSLLGFCDERGEQYLVYEYCCNGNLAQNLLRIDSVLSWDQRVRILRDCALVLRFLHNHPDGCIVHRDIKLSNILLMENMEPKLSDFGLAKVFNMEESKVFTDVRGTIGYMDPEYMTNARLTSASDIYSFGIVTLQMLSGRKVIELDIAARDTLTRKAKDVQMKKRPLKDFIDPRLRGELNLRDFESILNIAVLCAAGSSKGRPTIKEVFEEMDRAWKNTKPNMLVAAAATSGKEVMDTHKGYGRGGGSSVCHGSIFECQEEVDWLLESMVKKIDYGALRRGDATCKVGGRGDSSVQSIFVITRSQFS